MKGQTRNKSCQEMHMDIYTVTFLGHRTINNMREVEERLDEIIRKLLREKYSLISLSVATASLTRWHPQPSAEQSKR